MLKLAALIAVILPQRLKKLVYRKIFGWRIGQGVKIGFSYLDAEHVVLGDQVCIGHFNIVRHLKYMRIGDGSYIANYNQFFGGRYQDAKWSRKLVIGNNVQIMSRHFIDVAGDITIGNSTTIGGRDTQLWSHTLDFKNPDSPSLEPLNITVGDHVYIGARATLIGCGIPDLAVVGAGSVVTKTFPAATCRQLIAGNPAVVKKRYQQSEKTAAP